jgi:hypothetical protein
MTGSPVAGRLVLLTVVSVCVLLSVSQCSLSDARVLCDPSQAQGKAMIFSGRAARTYLAAWPLNRPAIALR